MCFVFCDVNIQVCVCICMCSDLTLTKMLAKASDNPREYIQICATTIKVIHVLMWLAC